MDEYLQCLYNYVMEHLLNSALDSAKYKRCAAAQIQAWETLKAALSPEQLELVEDFQSAQAETCALEDQLLFQSAVSLGKWMVQS